MPPLPSCLNTLSSSENLWPFTITFLFPFRFVGTKLNSMGVIMDWVSKSCNLIMDWVYTRVLHCMSLYMAQLYFPLAVARLLVLCNESTRIRHHWDMCSMEYGSPGPLLFFLISHSVSVECCVSWFNIYFQWCLLLFLLPMLFTVYHASPSPNICLQYFASEMQLITINQ